MKGQQLELIDCIQEHNKAESDRITQTQVSEPVVMDRPTQREGLRNFFISKINQWIPLPEIMRFSAQYNARIYELRRMGLNIINKTKEINGVKHSWYMLIGG